MRRRAGALELSLALDHPNQLFEPRPPDVSKGLPGGPPAIEQLQQELASHLPRGPVRVTIELPREQLTPQLETGLRQAITSYCDAGITRAEDELLAIRRDGTNTLVLGAVLLGVCLAISETILQSGAPKDIREFFGNGLFIVAAWVGMWYPLDTLIYSGRPHRLERRLLRAMRDMDIVLRARDEG